MTLELTKAQAPLLKEKEVLQELRASYEAKNTQKGSPENGRKGGFKN